METTQTKDLEELDEFKQKWQQEILKKYQLSEVFIGSFGVVMMIITLNQYRLSGNLFEFSVCALMNLVFPALLIRVSRESRQQVLTLIEERIEAKRRELLTNGQEQG